MLNGPLCEGAPAKRVGERPCYATSYPPYKWCQSHLIDTIYTLPKSAIRTLSKNRKKFLTKVIHLAIIIKLSREGTAAKACNYSLYGDFEAERLQKISKKVLDKRTFMRYNIQAVTEQVTAQQDLEN